MRSHTGGRRGALVLGALVATTLNVTVAAAQCPEQWAILHGSQFVGAAAQPLPPQTIDMTWFMRQTSGSGLYGTWRVVRQVSEFSFQSPLPAVPPSGPTTTSVGNQTYPCWMSYTATSAVMDCQNGIDYQVTPQGIFVGNIRAGTVQNGELQIETLPADAATTMTPMQANAGAMTMTGRPGSMANQVQLNLTAVRNSALAPSSYRVFVTVRVDPVALLDSVTLRFDYPGVTLSGNTLSADGLSRTLVYGFPGTSQLTAAMLDQPLVAELSFDTCRITATTTLRNLL